MNEQIFVKQAEEKSSLYITGQELSIIKAIVEGKTSKEIGTDLNITPKTVETHRHNILRRLKCKNMPQVVNILHKQGILS